MNNHTVKVYRPRYIKPQQILFCEAFLSNGLNATEAARVAGYRNPESNAHLILERKAVSKYLKNRAKRLDIAGVNYDYKLDKLRTIIDESVDEYSENKTVQHAQAGMAAIDILNKMQGHYAPVTTQAVTVNVKATQDKLLEARKQYDEY